MLCTQMDGDGYLQNREQDLLQLIVEKFNNNKITRIGPRHTRYFDTQYCDKKILR